MGSGTVKISDRFFKLMDEIGDVAGSVVLIAMVLVFVWLIL